jgi:hypothetical protein
MPRATIGAIVGTQRRIRLRRACDCAEPHGDRASAGRLIRPANGTHAKLCGQGPRAEAAAACGLPRIPLDSDTRSATCMTPSRFCSAEALQRRAEAGPQRLQREVRRRAMSAGNPAGVL